jgi:hypothetical protein
VTIHLPRAGLADQLAVSDPYEDDDISVLLSFVGDSMMICANVWERIAI